LDCRRRAFNVLWVRRKETHICTFFFSQKFPVNENTPGSPTGHLWREIPIYKTFITYLSRF
jgi:hypothetical protein